MWESRWTQQHRRYGKDSSANKILTHFKSKNPHLFQQSQCSDRFLPSLRACLSQHCALGLEESVRMSVDEICATLTIHAGVPQAVMAIMAGDHKALEAWPLIVCESLGLEVEFDCDANPFCTNISNITECAECNASICRTCRPFHACCGSGPQGEDLQSHQTAATVDTFNRFAMLADFEDYFTQRGPFRGEHFAVRYVLWEWKCTRSANNRATRVGQVDYDGRTVRIVGALGGNEFIRLKIVELHRSLVSYDTQKRFFDDVTSSLTDCVITAGHGFVELLAVVGRTECSCAPTKKIEAITASTRKPASKIQNQRLFRPRPAGFRLAP